MGVRTETVKAIGKRTRKLEEQSAHSLQFGSKVFSLLQMEQSLPKKVFHNLLLASEGKEKLDLAHAEQIAAAMKDWAVKEGATPLYPLVSTPDWRVC